MDPLKVGHVIGVDGDCVDIKLTCTTTVIEYHGTEYRVGRLGTYITIPIGRVTLIGYVTKVASEENETNEVDENSLPPRSMQVQLLGTVRNDKFSRGVSEYPTLGDIVRLGVDEDFELIFGCFDQIANADGMKRSFAMGRFAVDTDFEVKVMGKEFFAKHIAVMGNSGSGKSCTTAKILHEATSLPHSQVVLFDMHGEYCAAFSDENDKPLPNITYLSDRNLVLPYWMLQYEEFEQLFIDGNNPLNVNAQKVFLRSAIHRLKQEAAQAVDLQFEYTVDTPVYYSLENLKTYAENMNEARFVLNSENYAFSRLPFRQLPFDEQENMLMTRRMEFNKGNAEGEVPHATYFGRLLGFVNLLESRMNDRRYDFMLRPFEQAKRNPDLAGKLLEDGTPGDKSRCVSQVIRQLLGHFDQRRNLTIIDLSGLPFDVVDTTVAVITRALFDFNFWTPSHQRQPTLLVFEEAHNYLPKVPLKERKTFARDAVEKVAKEGRKYGVSAMVVSQRPSELSETLLSQCNSMVLMRMNNPDDQDYAARVVSDQFRSLISLLPSLKPGEGFIIGDAVLMPMRTLIDLPPRLPRSNDVDFFGLWSRNTNRVDAEQIVDRWWRQDRNSETIDPKAGTAGRPSAFVPARPVSLADMKKTVAPERPVAAPAPSDHPHDDGGTPSAIANEPAEGSTLSPAERKLADLAARLGRKE